MPLLANLDLLQYGAVELSMMVALTVSSIVQGRLLLHGRTTDLHCSL